MNNLSRLEEDVRQSFDYLCLNTDPWVPRSADIDDVVTIVGAGQNGIATAYALRRKGIVARVIEAEKEGAEGVWLKRARMRSLRTPKDRPGPELSIPALTFKAWYVAKFGIDAYLAMGLPPRETWADYLVWFRKVLQIEVEFETRLISVEPLGPNLKLVVSANDAHRTITTRKVILATGLSAGGTVNIPTVIADNLPRHRFAHTNDVIDFGALKGKRIGILGASASGFDAAATALENGAASARVFCRSSDLARGTRSRLVDFPGADYFHLLPDEERWRVASLYLTRGNHPPPTAIARAAVHEHFHLHLGSPWENVHLNRHAVQVESQGKTFEFDFLIVATGFCHNPTLAPELRSIASNIALWNDRYVPPLEERNEVLGDFPYLGDALQFLQKVPGAFPCIPNIHVVNMSALLSHLRIVGDIKCLGFTSERLANGIVRDLFLADRSAHIARLTSPIVPELSGAEYANLVWKAPDGVTKDKLAQV